MSLIAPPRANLVGANLICTLSMLSWAAGLPVADVLIPHIPALPLTAARMAIAGLVLVLVWLAVEGAGAIRSASWIRAIGIGTLLTVAGALLILGQARTDAVTVAIISASLPIAGIALEVALDGRRLRFSLVLGVMLSILGGIIALTGQKLGVSLGLGTVFCLASVVLYTVASRLSVTALPRMSPLGRTAATVAGAGLAATVIAFGAQMIGGPAPQWSALGAREIGALIVFAVFSMAISQLLWVWSVGSLGIGLAALHINAAPFYVMLIALGFGGTWQPMQAIGAAVVVLGVMVAQGLLRLPSRQG